jgi:hypothetical protein
MIYLSLSVLFTIVFLNFSSLKLKNNSLKLNNYKYGEYDDYDYYYNYEDYNNNYDNEYIKKPDNKLRGTIIQNIVDDKFKSIYSNIVKQNKKGLSNNYFSIVCIDLKNKTTDQCEKYDGYDEWKNQQKKTNNIIGKNKIEPKIIRNRIVYKFIDSFGEENVTKIYKNCCDYYKITM